MVVTYTAPCPQCGVAVMWTQATKQGQFGIETGDITIHCRCDAPQAA